MPNVFADFETCVCIPNYNYNYCPEDIDKSKVIKTEGIIKPWLLCFKVENAKNILHTVNNHQEFFDFLGSLKGKVVL